MSTTTLPKTIKIFNTPALARSYGRRGGGKLKVKIEAHAIGKQAPYFSITADLYSPRWPDSPFAGGCLHDEISRVWAAARPMIALHLSDAGTGELMHAGANGWYWFAGALGGLGEQYHGGAGRTTDECLTILAKHVRLPRQTVAAVVESLHSVFADDIPALKMEFAAWINDQRERWREEAATGMALIVELGKAKADRDPAVMERAAKICLPGA